MRIIRIFPLIFLYLMGCETVNDSNPADEIKSIMLIDADIEDEYYDVLMENKFSNVKVPAEIIISDRRIPVYFEPQGAGSRYFSKWGYSITCREGNRIDGLSEFNLSIQQYDKAKVRTALASWMYLKAGLPVFHSNHCFLKINDENKGLYVLTERIEDDFFSRRNMHPDELIKVVFGAKFTFSTVNTLHDHFEKKIPDDGNFNNLAEFIYAVDTVKPGSIITLSKYLDINGYLKYHALTSIMNNSDGITNNFYFYRGKDSTGYSIIPWDFDKTFDPKAKIPLFSGNELMDKLMQSDSLSNLYRSHLKTVLYDIFNKENLYPIIDSVYAKISSAFSLDPYLGNSVSLNDEINSLKLFIINRRENLLKELNL